MAFLASLGNFIVFGLFVLFFPLLLVPHSGGAVIPSKMRGLFGGAVEQERFPWKMHMLRDTQCCIAVEQ